MFERNEIRQGYASTAVSYSEGLRQHFVRVYNTMCMGLVITGLTAYGLSLSKAAMEALFTSPVAYVVMLAPMAFILFGFTPNRIVRMSANSLKLMFYAFCAVFGLSFSMIFIAFTGQDIARAFFVTAATFLAMSIFGYSTKKDLSQMASFLLMGTIGIFIAIIVNWFLQSSALEFIISGVGVVVYTLWTAFHTQSIKQSYSTGHSDESNNKAAYLGALSLYIDFMMLFQFILSLMSGRE